MWLKYQIPIYIVNVVIAMVIKIQIKQASTPVGNHKRRWKGSYSCYGLWGTSVLTIGYPLPWPGEGIPLSWLEFPSPLPQKKPGAETELWTGPVIEAGVLPWKGMEPDLRPATGVDRQTEVVKTKPPHCTRWYIGGRYFCGTFFSTFYLGHDSTSQQTHVFLLVYFWFSCVRHNRYANW